MHRYGGFDDLAVIGDCYEQGSGRFREITIVSAEEGRIKSSRINMHYSVSGEVIQCRKADIAFPELEAKVGGIVEDVEPSLKQGILAQILSWENEADTK